MSHLKKALILYFIFFHRDIYANINCKNEISNKEISSYNLFSCINYCQTKDDCTIISPYLIEIPINNALVDKYRNIFQFNNILTSTNSQKVDCLENKCFIKNNNKASQFDNSISTEQQLKFIFSTLETQINSNFKCEYPDKYIKPTSEISFDPTVFTNYLENQLNLPIKDDNDVFHLICSSYYASASLKHRFSNIKTLTKNEHAQILNPLIEKLTLKIKSNPQLILKNINLFFSKNPNLQLFSRSIFFDIFLNDDSLKNNLSPMVLKNYLELYDPQKWTDQILNFYFNKENFAQIENLSIKLHTMKDYFDKNPEKITNSIFPFYFENNVTGLSSIAVGQLGILITPKIATDNSDYFLKLYKEDKISKQYCIINSVLKAQYSTEPKTSAELLEKIKKFESNCISSPKNSFPLAFQSKYLDCPLIQINTLGKNVGNSVSAEDMNCLKKCQTDNECEIIMPNYSLQYVFNKKYTQLFQHFSKLNYTEDLNSSPFFVKFQAKCVNKMCIPSKDSCKSFDYDSLKQKYKIDSCQKSSDCDQMTIKDLKNQNLTIVFNKFKPEAQIMLESINQCNLSKIQSGLNLQPACVNNVCKMPNQ